LGNVSVHDSICLAVPVGEVDSAAQYLETLMTRPVPELGGLQFGIEIKTGTNWADMTTIKEKRYGT
jgi:DNA polymerase I-like protein with 3'-5' exonuclease and polymerase domains